MHTIILQTLDKEGQKCLFLELFPTADESRFGAL